MTATALSCGGGRGVSRSRSLVQVYGGSDGGFTLYEDDGATLDYKKGGAHVRRTRFSWSQASKTLSWQASAPHVPGAGAGGGNVVCPPPCASQQPPCSVCSPPALLCSAPSLLASED